MSIVNHVKFKQEAFLGVLPDVDNCVLTPRFVREQIKQLLVVQLKEGNLHQELVPAVLPNELEDVLNKRKYLYNKLKTQVLRHIIVPMNEVRNQRSVWIRNILFRFRIRNGQMRIRIKEVRDFGILI